MWYLPLFNVIDDSLAAGVSGRRTTGFAGFLFEIMAGPFLISANQFFDLIAFLGQFKSGFRRQTTNNVVAINDDCNVLVQFAKIAFQIFKQNIDRARHVTFFIKLGGAQVNNLHWLTVFNQAIEANWSCFKIQLAFEMFDSL